MQFIRINGLIWILSYSLKNNWCYISQNNDESKNVFLHGILRYFCKKKNIKCFDIFCFTKQAIKKKTFLHCTFRFSTRNNELIVTENYLHSLFMLCIMDIRSSCLVLFVKSLDVWYIGKNILQKLQDRHKRIAEMDSTMNQKYIRIIKTIQN